MNALSRHQIGVRLAIAGIFATLVVALPALQGVRAATLDLSPAADAWVNRQSPTTNYGTARTLRAAAMNSEAVLRFRTDAWSGQPVTALTLTLQPVGGNPAALAVEEASNSWKESTVTWQTRPASLMTLDSTAAVSSTSVTFDVSGLFPGGTVDRNVVTLRVRNVNADVVTFSSRESATPPRLSLNSTPPAAQPESLEPLADTWADSTNGAKTHGANRSLYVDRKPRKEAFLLFDVSAWQGSPYKKMELRLEVGTAGGPGLSVYRIGSAWSESALTWVNRPTGGTLVADVPTGISSGRLTLDISSAFPAGEVETRKLSLRIATTGTGGFDFSSREGVEPPSLLLTPGSGSPTPSPTAAPTATATARPTASPTAPPTASPTASPTPPPTASPTATPTAVPSPSACPTPVPLFYFEGRGTDHGVGMSQQGAKGRAIAGQKYDEILAFYYTDVDFSTIDGSAPIRVLLADDFMPSATLPARVVGYVGGWQSAAFPGMTFPQGSYVELWPPSPATPTPSPTAVPAMTINGGDLVAAAATPTASPTAVPSPTGCATPPPALATVVSEQAKAVAAPSPTPAAANAPAPTPTPTVPTTPSPTAPTTPSPSPTVSTTPVPSPTADPTQWVATAYDSLGNVLATAATNDLVVEAIEAEGILEMRFRDDAPKYKLYRGQMRLLVTPSGLRAINTLPMESYLRGVVPAEVPASWPIEAVKTQAVAARTYAWARLKGDLRDWDVVPTAANQVYGGYQHEHANSDRAVLGTQNIVLTYNGRVISALFHANAGGHTENSEYAFVNDRGNPGTIVPYLRGKPDVDENGVPYDINSGTYDWQSGQFTMADLSRIMSNNDLTNVGTIHNMTFHRGVSGRVYKVVLEGSAGTTEVSGGKFKNTYNNFRTPGTPNMVSTLFFLTPVAP